MISQIDLQHFKCFELLKLPLAELTLLSGSNASGKSSVLQAFVLLHQTMCEQEWSSRLMLNGETLKLGTVQDVIDKVHGRNRFKIDLIEGNERFSWTFQGGREEMSLDVTHLEVSGKSYVSPKQLHHLLPVPGAPMQTDFSKRLCNLSYITAERVGPREFYPLKDIQSAKVVGPLGEHALSVLHWGGEEKVIPGLAIEGLPPTRIRQVEAQMQRFFPGSSLQILTVPGANVVTLGLRTSDDTHFHRPIHVGFGLTQVLPILIAALSATKGDLLLVENPEVHLHPAGQALMGQFLAEVATAGIQVIIETHSDHVLNGIRRSVKAHRLLPDQVALHFFRPRINDLAQVTTLLLDSDGNLDTWPEGFFDQYDKDINYFAGWGD